MTGKLNLFAGKRQRGKRPPPALEFATHCAIADLLRVAIAPGWLWYHPGNGENRDAITGARLQRMGLRPGVSDFIFIAPPSGRTFALELKRRGQKPTEAQARFLAAVRDAGGLAEWVDSFDAAVAVLERWGAVRVAATGGRQ